MQHLPKPVSIWKGEFLQFYDVKTDRRNPKRHWEYVSRPMRRNGVTLVPLTRDGRIIFIEQFRWPLRRYVLELPAGMIESDERHSNRATVAAELEEETGAEVGRISFLARGPLLPGVTDELNEFFLVEVTSHPRIIPGTFRLKGRTGNREEGEDIRAVYAVPAARAADWLERRAKRGGLVDLRTYVGLFLSRRKAERTLRRRAV